MPAAAAASSRNRHARPGRSNDAPTVSGGLLVTRKMPTPQKSRSNVNSSSSSSKKASMRKLPTGQRSFRQKMTNSMSQWKSVPALHKQSSTDEVSIASSSSRTNRTKSRSKSPHRSTTVGRSRSPTHSVRSTRSTRSRTTTTVGRSKSPRRGGGGRDQSPKRQQSLLCLERPKPTRQKSNRHLVSRENSGGGSIVHENNNKAGLKRFLSRGNSVRTAETFRSLETISDRLNPQTTPPLSACFPPSHSTQQFLIRRPSAKGEFTTIENQKGVIVAVVEETHYGRRLLKNPDGKVCAMILLHDEKYSSKKYSICGSEPVVYKQSIKYDQVGLGYYKWAHVKNAGGFGGTISLKHTKDEVKQLDYTYCTKMFGSVFRLKKSRGHVVLDGNKKECAKLIPLHNTGRAIQVGPKMDTALMLCYSVIIDEILEMRIK